MIGQSEWTEDERLRADERASQEARMVAMFPPGSRFSLVCAGYTKWMLAAFRFSHAVQLEMLEGLSTLVHDHFTARALAEVRPCIDPSAAMITTALDNDAADEKLSRSFKVLTGREVFGELLRLNPSWLRAIRMCGGQKAA